MKTNSTYLDKVAPTSFIFSVLGLSSTAQHASYSYSSTIAFKASSKCTNYIVPVAEMKSGKKEAYINNGQAQNVVSKQAIIGMGYNNSKELDLSDLPDDMYVAESLVNWLVFNSEKVIKS